MWGANEERERRKRLLISVIRFCLLYNCMFDPACQPTKIKIDKLASHDAPQDTEPPAPPDGDDIPDSVACCRNTKRIKRITYVKMTLGIVCVTYASALILLYHTRPMTTTGATTTTTTAGATTTTTTRATTTTTTTTTGATTTTTTGAATATTTKVRKRACPTDTSVFYHLDPAKFLARFKNRALYLVLLMMVINLLRNVVNRLFISDAAIMSASNWLAAYECGFDRLIDHYLNLLANTHITSILYKIALLQWLAAHNLDTVSRPVFIIDRFYPLLWDPKTLEGHVGPIDAAKWAALPNDITPQGGQLSATHLKTTLWAMAIGSVLSNLVGTYLYAEFEWRNCSRNLNHPYLALLYAFHFTVHNIMYWWFIVSGLVNILLATSAIQLIRGQLVSQQLAVRMVIGHLREVLGGQDGAGEAGGGGRGGGWGVDMENSIEIIVINLIRINNYIAWKVSVLNRLTTRSNAIFWVWLVTTMVMVVSFLARNSHQMNLYEVLIAVFFIFMYLASLLAYLMGATLNKELAQTYRDMSSLNAQFVSIGGSSLVRYYIRTNISRLYDPNPLFGLDMLGRITKANLLVTLSWILTGVTLVQSFIRPTND